VRGSPPRLRPWGSRIFLLALLLLAPPCAAKTLVVLLLPGTSLADWRRADAPALHEIIATGAVAVMNTRTARLPSDRVRETPESAALTLGAGARAAGGSEATDFRRTDAVVPGVGVTAWALYARRMGLRPPPAGQVNVQWPRLLRENAAQGYDIHLGNLAEALRRAGVSVRAAGGPLAWAVAADGQGVVAPNSGGAGGECIVWDAGGDVAAADRVLGRVLARIADGRLIVLSPDAGDAPYAHGDRLCPIVVWGPGVPPGLIYSPATRRAGLVTNTDFAPSVADYFGASLPVMAFGRPWEYRPAPEAVDRAAGIEAGAVRQWHGKLALPALAVFLGVWMVGGTLLAAWGRLPGWAVAVPAGVILALILSVSQETLALWLGAFALLIFAAARQGAADLALGLTAAIAVALVGDMLLGDPLMRSGLLGYSAIEGARYYGIGNEAMGPLVGACLVVADGLWLRFPNRHPLLWGGLLLVTALLGSPLAGAKAGGLIVAPAAFGSYTWLRSGRRWDWRIGALMLAGMAALLAGVAVLDSRMGTGNQSHFGQAVGRLLSGGAGEWRDIIGRKLAVEGRLLYHSAWAVPLWGGLACLLGQARRHGGLGQALLRSALVAVIACLAVNDAGTVAASLCLAAVWGRWITWGQRKAAA